MLKLLGNYIPKVKPDKEFSSKFYRIPQELCLPGPSQSIYAGSPSVELLPRISLVVVISVDQHRHTQRVEYFGPWHVHIRTGCLLEIEGYEIQIVVSAQNVPVEFDV